MTLAVRLRPAADRDLEEAALWYDSQRRGLGLLLLAEVDRTLAMVADAPFAFPVQHRNLRCARVRRFPYSIIFEVTEGAITVLGGRR